jgi:hypothetical protein
MYTFPMALLSKASAARTTLLQLLIVFSCSLLVMSCKKGDTGPAGPAGTANVIYSDWFTPGSYTKDTVFGTYGFIYDKAAAAITQKIIDSGTVITFGKLAGYNPVIWPTGQIAALPINITYMNGSVANIDTWSALVTPGNLRIQLQSSTNAYGGISNLHQFRYIIIPGGAKTTSSVRPGLATGSGNVLNDSQSAALQEVRENYSQMEYAEICQRLGIPQ